VSSVPILKLDVEYVVIYFIAGFGITFSSGINHVSENLGVAVFMVIIQWLYVNSKNIIIFFVAD
jgi:hypothetical protein